MRTNQTNLLLPLVCKIKRQNYEIKKASSIIKRRTEKHRVAVMDEGALCVLVWESVESLLILDR